MILFYKKRMKQKIKHLVRLIISNYLIKNLSEDKKNFFQDKPTFSSLKNLIGVDFLDCVTLRHFTEGLPGLTWITFHRHLTCVRIFALKMSRTKCVVYKVDITMTAFLKDMNFIQYIHNSTLT